MVILTNGMCLLGFDESVPYHSFFAIDTIMRWGRLLYDAGTLT